MSRGRELLPCSGLCKAALGSAGWADRSLPAPQPGSAQGSDLGLCWNWPCFSQLGAEVDEVLESGH